MDKIRVTYNQAFQYFILGYCIEFLGNGSIAQIARRGDDFDMWEHAVKCLWSSNDCRSGFAVLLSDRNEELEPSENEDSCLSISGISLKKLFSI